MFKRLLLYLSTAAWARHIVTRWGIARHVARRFVAGEQLQEAIAATQELNRRNIAVTLDYLGESVTRAEDTQDVVETYLNVLDSIQREGLQSGISVKLTHLGFDISEELCVTNLRHILTRAKQYGLPVTIDMESTAYTDDTLRIYRTMRDEYGFDNVGTVLQAYLYRTEKDVAELVQENAHIRLCKGAYLEPPTHAFPNKADVDKNYVKLVEQFLAAKTNAYLCIATHDEAMIQAAEASIKRLNVPKERYEFQMLYGVRTPRQEELAKQHTMRVYVPFGEAWYPYFMRRLAERPANVWFFVKSLVR